MHYAALSGHKQIVIYLITEQRCNRFCVDSDNWTPLHFACQGGHIEIIEYIISKPESLKEMTKKSQVTLLHCASKYGCIDIMRNLIGENICDLNIGDEHQQTPLHYACMSGNIVSVRFLISEFKCDLNLKDTDQQTPLHFATQYGHIDVVKYLATEKGCDLQAKDKDQQTSLHLAILHGHESIVCYLVNEKECFPANNKEDQRILIQYALRLDKYEIPLYLISLSSVRHYSSDLNTELFLLACKVGNLDLVKSLISRFPKCIMSTGKDEETALHISCRYGHREVTQYLIEDHKCDFEATDVFKLTPKHYASLYGHKGIIEYFNTLRVYYNKSDSDPFLTYSLSCSALNQTEFFSDILFLACKVGHLGFVKFIVEVPKWSPDIYDDDQLTPLYHACENGNVEIISFLLSQPSYHPNISDKQKVIFEACKIGALELVLYIVEVHKFNPEVYDDNQKTPLYYACLNGFSHIALYLLEQVHILHSGYLNNDMFFAACRKGLVDVLKRLFTVTALKKVITNASNQTLLHCGCIYGHLDVVSYLISEQNYDLKAVDLNNSTPLDYALQNNHIQIVEYLRGDMKDEYGIVAARYSLTPLYDACLNGCLITVRYFIDIKGYSPEVRDEDGRTPLHCASQNSHCDIVKYLIIEKGCDPDVVDRDNFTALHYICSYEHSADDKKACEVVRFLINSAKCNLKIAAKSGSTPLHFACMYGKRDIIKILLSDGKSDPNVKNNAGKTPYDELCSPLDLDILKEFINHDMNAAITYNNVIVIPKEEDSLEFMKILTYTRSWNPSKQTDDGDSALHIACQANKPKLVNFLLCYTECDPNVKNNCGKTPLYMSPYWWTQRGLIRLFANHGARDAYGLMIVHVSEEEAADFIKKLCLNGKDSWNPNLLDSTGKTLLHYACEANRPRIVHTLLAEGSCNPNIRNCAGLTPVYLNSNPDIIGKLVQYGADLYSVYSVLTQLPEDTALQVFDYLSLNCAAWDPNKKTADGEIALHFACRMNYLKLAHHLLPKAMLMDDPDIIRPVFFHSDALSLEVVKHYSQCHPDWDPNMIYSEGCNMLHLACMANYKMTTHHLLAEKNCNPNTLDQMGNSPLELSSDPAIIKELIQYGANPINVYQHYGKVLGTKQPLQPAVKVFVVGNPSAGKSTLTAALQKELSLLARAFSTNKKVSGVDEKTAGVIPYEFESKKYGRVTLYDFAGQKEFYSSHAALLQNAIKISPPIFLLVVNISDSNEELNQTITYWLSFLKHQCTSVSSRPHVIVVGSHADILISKGEDPNKKCRVVDSICAGPVDFGIEYTGFISMDCQFTESNGMVELRRNLKHSCDALRIQENISFNAHCFQIYLIDKCHGLAAIQIKDIRAKMAENQQSTTSGIMSFIPNSLHSLFNVCKELNDRGHIFFLADSENAENSWIILNKAALLSEVTGTIFAPEGFKQHCQLASSTGVVPLCKLREQFPDLNPRMLVGFLSHLEFCHEINDHEILKLIEEHQAITEVEYSPNEQYFYFPALVRLQTPDNMWIFRPEYSCVFGWIVQCSQPTDFFTPWFHQVLLLRLAFHFALIPSKEETNLQVPSIQRKCTVWKNGIFWGNRHGIEALVEILPDNKDVIFLIRGHECKLLEFMELRSQVLLKVRECVNDFCENILITEGLINRSEVAKYPFSPTSIVVLHMTEILKALLTSSTFIVASNGTSYLIKDLLTFEPYFELREKLLQQLCHEYASKCNKKVTDEFISSLSSCVKKSDVFVKMFDNKLLKQSDEDLSCALYSWINTSGGTYRQFRERLDHFSVFSGRNILVNY